MSSFQQRLYGHEVNPPATAWERIADALEREQVCDFPDTLYDAAATPPPAAWDRIAAALDKETPVIQTPAVPVNRTRVIPMMLRYAIAAAVIAAVATTAFFLTGTGSNKATGTASQQAVVPVITRTDSSIAVAPVPADAQTAAVAAPPAQPSADRLQAGTASRSVPASYTPGRTRNSRQQPQVSEYQNPLYAYEDHIPAIAERYVMLMTPDGDFIRMSKKLGTMVCCVTGQEQDEQCRNQIRRLQQELASSPVGQGNVLDVLGIVNSLDNSTSL